MVKKEKANMENMLKIINKIKTWWKNFVKNHIIDEVHPDDLDF